MRKYLQERGSLANTSWKLVQSISRQAQRLQPFFPPENLQKLICALGPGQPCRGMPEGGLYHPLVPCDFLPAEKCTEFFQHRLERGPFCPMNTGSTLFLPVRRLSCRNSHTRGLCTSLAPHSPLAWSEKSCAHSSHSQARLPKPMLGQKKVAPLPACKARNSSALRQHYNLCNDIADKENLRKRAFASCKWFS